MDESESQASQSEMARNSLDPTSAAVAASVAMRPPTFDTTTVPGTAASAAGPGSGGITAGAPVGSLGRGNSLQQLVRPTQVPGIQPNGLRSGNMNQCKCLFL